MTTLPRLVLCLWCALLLIPVSAQPLVEPEVVQYWDFEQMADPWVSLNPQAIVGLTAAQDDVLAGTSSLEVKYLFRAVNTGMEGILNGSAVVPLPGGAPGMAGISLWFKSSKTTTALVGGRENGGGAYMAPFFAPAGMWQQVTLGLDDFYPMDEMPDPNGKLDPEQLEGLGVVDASGFLSTLLGKLPVAGFEPGARRMYLDEVKLLAVAPEKETVPYPLEGPAPVVLDSCDREAIRWIVVGGRDWKAIREADEPNDQGAGTGHYRFEYTLPGGTLVAWLKPVRQGQLADTKALHLALRAGQKLTLMVSVEEKGKARYAQQIEANAGDEWTYLTIPWDDLSLEKDSKDDNGKLDPEQITLLTLADPSGLAGEPEDYKRVLWLNGVCASK